jgi:hypothetical protein
VLVDSAEPEPERVDHEGESIDPRGVIRDPSIDLPNGYVYGVTRFADVVLRQALPERFADLIDSLERFSIPLDEVREGGGGRTRFVKRFDDSLGNRRDGDGQSCWGKRNITIERRIGFDGDVRPVARTRGHEIDMFGQASPDVPFPGVAVEMEWNNKDPFYDRDLINFQALHREGAIVAGVIITRGPTLQEVLSVVLDKYGVASTHWDKLTPRVNLGGGGECPLLLIGIEPDRIAAVDEIMRHYAFAEEARQLKREWRDRGYGSWNDARPEVDRLFAQARIDRLQRHE